MHRLKHCCVSDFCCSITALQKNCNVLITTLHSLVDLKTFASNGKRAAAMPICDRMAVYVPVSIGAIIYCLLALLRR